MFTFETSDQKEARRFRIAQFNGRTATAQCGGTTVTGHVRSIVEKKSTIPVLWLITIVAEMPKAGRLNPGPAPRLRAFAEENH